MKAFHSTPTLLNFHIPVLKNTKAFNKFACKNIRCLQLYSSNGVQNNSIQLEYPIPILQDAKIVYAAVPAMNHHQEGHPETNQRVPAILNALSEANLTPEFRKHEIIRLSNFQSASAEDVAVVHDFNYVKGLKWSMAKAAEEGLIILEAGGPTFATPWTYNDCLLASGAGFAIIDSVVQSSGKNRSCPAGFAIVRPPGHHAIPQGPMGFCLFDHIAIAAKYVQNRYNLKKVFIFDFDVHHGNGTHDMFYSDPNIFFLSTHQLGSYPGTGKMEEVGEGEGEGTTLNLPLPGGAGDVSMAMVMDEVIAPIILNFKPDIILVSAGYDAHYMDPLAGMQFSSHTYHHLTSSIHALAKQVCEGRIVYFLEGGYNLKSLSFSVADTFRAFLGEKSQSSSIDIPSSLYEEPIPKVKKAIERIKSIHSLN